MNEPKWIAFGMALAMMSGTACVLHQAQGGRTLSQPGVKVGARPISDDKGRVISQQSVLLPDEVPGASVIPGFISESEVTGLPPDTTFGRCFIKQGDFQAQVTAVLMGHDRASIHQPQYCLIGGGWNIDRTERASIPMTRPYPYSLPVMKLKTSRKDPHGAVMGGIYVYWFVSRDKITAEELGRTWSMAWTVLTTGVRERWAYISYFAACHPEQEEATFERLERLIQDSTPEFQLVAGPRAATLSSIPAQN